MAKEYTFERCPACMEPMDVAHKCCSICSFFCDFVTKDTYINGDLLHLPANPQLPFHAGARIRRTDFGSVYLGYNTQSRRKVLLKEFFPFPLIERDTGGEFPRFRVNEEEIFRKAAEGVILEAQKLSKKVIPGAEQVHGAFWANGTVYQVTEYICGPSMQDISLGELWKTCSLLFPRNEMERKIPELSFYRLLRPLLLLLQRMHFNGIYHGNLDPSCILLDMEHPRLVLGNLGTREARSRHRSASTSIVSYNEFLAGNYLNLTPVQQDIFAVCNVIYYILAGTLPPWNEYHPRTESEATTLPRVIENVLMKGSSPQKIKSFSGMAELIAALDDAFMRLARLQK